MMKTLLILTVGTSSDPILKAIEEARQERPAGSVVVMLLYGRPLAGQKRPTPFDVAYEAKQKAEALDIDVRLIEIADPEDVDRALTVSRQVFQDPVVMQAERVIVNFTGGTKVMSAAAVHVALTASLVGELILDYTGGEVRDEHGKVLRSAMRVKRAERTATAELLQQVAEYLKRFNYRDAYSLSRRLPKLGKAGFVRDAVEGLYRWDEFDYEAAVPTFQRLSDQARVLIDDPEWSGLVRLLRRLLEPGRQMKDCLQRVLRPAQEKGDRPPPEAVKPVAFFIADALENGGRRITEGRLTDSVLRYYRAVEMAVQGRLLRAGINPWLPDWKTLDSASVEAYLKDLQATAPPRELALRTGLTLLKTMGHVYLDERQWKYLRDLQRVRNLSYLEHGFDRVDGEAARRVGDYAADLCECIWGMPLAEARVQVRHEVE